MGLTFLLWVASALGLAAGIVDFGAARWDAVTAETMRAFGEGEDGFALSYAERLTPAHGLECVLAHVDERTPGRVASKIFRSLQSGQTIARIVGGLLGHDGANERDDREGGGGRNRLHRGGCRKAHASQVGASRAMCSR